MSKRNQSFYWQVLCYVNFYFIVFWKSIRKISWFPLLPATITTNYAFVISTKYITEIKNSNKHTHFISKPKNRFEKHWMIISSRSPGDVKRLDLLMRTFLVITIVYSIYRPLNQRTSVWGIQLKIQIFENFDLHHALFCIRKWFM